MKTYIYIFDNISLDSSYNEKCFRTNTAEKIKIQFYVQFFFLNSCSLLGNVENML